VKPVPFEPLDPGMYRELVRRALAEDFGWGDVTTETIIDREQKARGVIMAKSSCVMAGIEIAAEAFRQLDPAVSITIHCPDGRRCERLSEVAEIRGHAGPLLTSERTALNFLQRLCGIATLTRQFVDIADGRIMVLDTRKTTPVLRALEKYAVRAGGGVNHRGGLDDGILIKDNHIRLLGSLGGAVTQMRKLNREMPTEVEAQTLAQVDEALEAGAEIIMLDNLSTDEIIEAVRRCRGRAKTEISGGVTLQRMRELAATGADYVSIGALTHSAPAVDLSFEIEPLG
jgi:nicotinate-nucleotide pyrophosphorylase (carboxylating)